jgi:hypothetical protein
VKTSTIEAVGIACTSSTYNQFWDWAPQGEDWRPPPRGAPHPLLPTHPPHPRSVCTPPGCCHTHPPSWLLSHTSALLAAVIHIRPPGCCHTHASKPPTTPLLNPTASPLPPAWHTQTQPPPPQHPPTHLTSSRAMSTSPTPRLSWYCARPPARLAIRAMCWKRTRTTCGQQQPRMGVCGEGCQHQCECVDRGRLVCL